MILNLANSIPALKKIFCRLDDNQSLPKYMRVQPYKQQKQFFDNKAFLSKYSDVI